MYLIRNRVVIFVVVLMSSCMLSAQSNNLGSIRGKLLDSLHNEPLAKATISIQSLKDSSLKGLGLTDDKGEFLIKNITLDSYSLIITYQGFQPIKKQFTLSTVTSFINFGNITMENAGVVLNELRVEASPIEIKKDTVEFRTFGFKTRLNATAEDLLKKFPGVEVDREGKIKTQGEEVQKVYVDGKEFFGSDPKIATRNLTADMIESVQVYNDMSDQAKFTRIDDGSRSKTINIKLKKNRQKGYFGKTAVGYGTTNRTQNALTYNNFNGESRVSIVGNYNNINRQAFNANDIASSSTGNNRLSNSNDNTGVNNGTSGINTSHSAGMNYMNRFGTKLHTTASYFYAETEGFSSKEGLTRTFYTADSTAIRSSVSQNNSKIESHRINLRMEYALDSNNSILYIPTIIHQKAIGSNSDSSFTEGVKSGVAFLDNSGFIRNGMETNNTALNNNILYRRKFNKWGRTLTFGYNGIINNNDGVSNNQSSFQFYNPNNTTRRQQNQQIKSKTANHSKSNVLSVSYTEPISKKDLLEFNYSYTNNFSALDRNTFNYDILTRNYDSIDAQLTNSFENSFQANRYGTNFKIQTQMYNFQIGGAVQMAHQANDNKRPIPGSGAKDSTIILTQNSINFFPSISFAYNFTRSRNLRVNYNGRTQQPTAIQLQQVPDVTNPLQIRVGNPALRQEFTHNITLAYNTFNPANFRYLNFNANVSQTAGKIVTSIDIVPQGLLNNGADKSVQLIKPINVNGVMNASSNITLGVPLRKLKNSNLNFTNSLFFYRNINVIYKLRNITNQLTISQSINSNFNFQDKLDLFVRAYVTYNKVTYSIQKSLNTNYFSQIYSADLSYSLSKSLLLYTDFIYTSNSGLAKGYDYSVAIWNASMAFQFLKKKKGELKLSINDLTNQNKSITTSVIQNYISNYKTTVIQRYFMITFTYGFTGSYSLKRKH